MSSVPKSRGSYSWPHLIACRGACKKLMWRRCKKRICGRAKINCNRTLYHWAICGGVESGSRPHNVSRTRDHSKSAVICMTWIKLNCIEILYFYYCRRNIIFSSTESSTVRNATDSENTPWNVNRCSTWHDNQKMRILIWSVDPHHPLGGGVDSYYYYYYYYYFKSSILTRLYNHIR